MAKTKAAKKKRKPPDEIDRLINLSRKEWHKRWKIIEACCAQSPPRIVLFQIHKFYAKQLKDPEAFKPDRASTKVLIDRLEEMLDDWNAGDYAVDEDD